MANYQRVIPRDFFNESKLLKCMGRFELCVNHIGCNGLDIKTDYDHKSFEIELSPDTVDLYVSNYHAFFEGEIILLYIPYNSRSNYPLFALYKGIEYTVFDEEGNWITDLGRKK